ncbi:uncharacterized protein EAF01_004669 [Botrytis porri]|nr:uncharacterized protein EAF01_004669 [Botrytis porri]KAF7907082.1 hypothetical protein EAF01_004669 [Botrytis porri]
MYNWLIENAAGRQKDVRNWLRGHSTLSESNFRCQEQHMRKRSPDTCSWLFSHEEFENWKKPDSKSPVLWVRAVPGAGKSVLTAFTESTFQTNLSFIILYYRRRKNLYSYELQSSLSILFISRRSLDEECDSDPRWEALSDDLSFFTELTRDKSYQFNLWCSSQDLTDLKKLLKDCAVIEVTEDTNSADIELYLSKSVLKLDSLDLDEGYQNLILQDLRQKADGCFLWASLMLDSVPSAVTLSAVQYQVQEGLPKDYENYYQNKIDKIEASQKPFVSVILSKILACIVYARRPLRLDELCESIAILDACDCDNVDKSQRLFRSMALKLCEPLVQIEDVDTAHGKISTCTLTHGSVPQFLVKHPQCLSRSETLACEFTEEVMAKVTFEDYTGEDVMEHHLLSHTTNYQDKHLDGVTYTPEICSRVQSFNTSPHLSIGGKVFNTGDCVHHVLDRVTNLGGRYLGEIDRVFWASIGPKNFLQRGRSHYKDFRFQATNEEQDLEIHSRYYTGLISQSGSGELEFTCQQWKLGTHRPKLTVSQELNASRMNWCFTCESTHNYSLNKMANIHLSMFLRKKLYFEDMTNSGPYIAIASRQNISHENLLDIQLTEDLILDYGEYITQRIIQQLAKGKEQAVTRASKSPATTIEKSQSSRSSSSSSNSSMLSLMTLILVNINMRTIEELDDPMVASDVGSDDNSAETDWSEGSALGDSYELDDDDQWNDWANERFNIEDLNEDFEHFDDSDDQRSDDCDDLGSDIPDIPDYDDLSDEPNESGNEEEIGGFGNDSDIEMISSGAPGYVLKLALLETDLEDTDSSVASNYSKSLYSGSESSDSEDDEDTVDNEEAHELEILYLGNKNLGEDAPRVSLQIFDTTMQEKTPIFHVRNTYFTRELCCSTYRSCHIFVKTRFSSCGEFDGRPIESEPKMNLSLQVSTHHLSSRKTAGSPPRLLFKINVPLGESSSMSISRLSYTLTWTDRELFFVTRGEELIVMRIPLFKGADDKTAPVCYTQNPIYLPRFAESRNVYYFPPSKSKEKDKSKGKEEFEKLSSDHILQFHLKD